ncbi:MAG TPA: DUF1206 domain-containing protein [Kofleriaceae bacterium]|nr:DUF1206 domain-containing protein [Kofleriaceae bacterium]
MGTAIGRARSWLPTIHAIGHATKGIVYLMVGGLALLSAAGKGGKVAGEEGAVRSLGEQPFGRFLLLAAAVGLACYALWRLLVAVFNLESERGAKGAGKRLAALASGLTHGALSVTAFQLGLGQRAHGHEGKAKIWVAKVLDQPYGDLLVGAVGLGLIAFAIHQAYCAAVDQLPDRLDARAGKWTRIAGRVGLGARAVVFAVIGARLLKAGIDERAHNARDIGSALRELGAQPRGAALLAAVAAGLAAYGVYQLLVARHGRVPGSS